MEKMGGSSPTPALQTGRGTVWQGGEGPASAPKVLFVYKDVLMKCIGSLLIWKLGEGGEQSLSLIGSYRCIIWANQQSNQELRLRLMISV